MSYDENRDFALQTQEIVSFIDYLKNNLDREVIGSDMAPCEERSVIKSYPVSAEGPIRAVATKPGCGFIFVSDGSFCGFVFIKDGKFYGKEGAINSIENAEQLAESFTSNMMDKDQAISTLRLFGWSDLL